tara:strand:+ start:1698 stop:2474 length:777 start_codon:yes stop_codon:yes gene_type:complete
MKITLLDGKVWDRDEILDKSGDDEFYYGYLGKYAFSSTAIKHLLSSPKTYRHILEYGQSEAQALRDGWLFHTCVLEPEVFNSQIFVNVQSKNTKKYKDAVKQYGKVFTLKEKHDAERLADALLRNELVLEKLNDAEFEQAEIGEVFGFPFRAKADVLTNNSEMYDLKSTASLQGWKYSADKYGYDVQAFLYCTLFDILPSKMGFIVIDKGSLDIGYAQVTDEFYERGMMKVKKALATYEEWFMREGADLDQYYINIEL